MNNRFHYTKLISIALGLSLIFTASLARGENDESRKVWNCTELLDAQTRSTLAGYEGFFASLFQLPSEYEMASEQGKKRLVNQWIRELRGGDNKRVAEAGAYLGMIKARGAVKSLEKPIADRRRGGRVRWVCTRSLGQIGDKSSIPVLISLLDNVNKNTRIYARVALAEITDVYFGDDKEKWKSCQSGKTPQLCTSTECKTGDFSKSQKSYSKNKLGFRLPDIYGRIVDSQDYAKSQQYRR